MQDVMDTEPLREALKAALGIMSCAQVLQEIQATREAQEKGADALGWFTPCIAGGLYSAIESLASTQINSLESFADAFARSASKPHAEPAKASSAKDMATFKVA